MNGKQYAAVAAVFVVAAVALAFVFGAVFDSYAIGIGPAIAVAVGIAAAAYFAMRDKKTPKSKV